MKCFLRRLTSVVSFFLLISSVFPLDIENLANEKLKEAFDDNVRLENVEVLASRIPEDYDTAELKVTRGSPRGYLYIRKGNKIFSIALNLSWKCGILIARRDIHPGERLNETNTEFTYKYLKRCPNVPEGSPNNYVAVRLIKENTPIKRSFLRKEFLVKRGDRVKAFYEDKNIRIEFESVAYDNGYYGDSVRIKSPFSGKLLRGIVVGEGVVKILE